MKILFLQPLATKEQLWGKYAVEGGFIPPIGILSIAGYLKDKGYQVKIIDCHVGKYTEKELSQALIKDNFDVIGIPIFTNTAVNSYYTAKICRQCLPKAKIVFGGVHATILPEQTMTECPETDFLVIGEGEITMEELLSNLQKGLPNLNDIKGLVFREGRKIVVNEKRDLISDINILPMPAYDLLDMSKYVPHPTQYKLLPSYPVIFQRGCPYNCAFCGAGTVHGRVVRHKSVDKLIEEIELLINKYGTRGIHFQDSTFTANRSYVVDFCNQILKKGLKFKWDINTRVDRIDDELLKLMKKAGLWMINFGLESGNQDSLNLMKKNFILKQAEEAIKMTRKNKIVSFSTWILGIPGENEEMVKNTIRFAKKIGTELVLFFLPVPYPGTDLVKICEKDGGLNKNAQWKDYSSADFSNPVYINPLLGKEKMQYWLRRAFFSYYFSPKIIWRNIKTIDCLEDIRRYWRGFRALIYSLI